MNATQTRIGWGALGILLLGALGAHLYSDLSAQDAPATAMPTVAPAKLLSADTVLFVQIDGANEHQEAWERTAAYEALQRAHVEEITTRLSDFINQKLGVASDEQLTAVLEHVNQHGVSVSVSIPSTGALPVPQVTLVLHNAAEQADSIKQMLDASLAGVIEFQEETLNGHAVQRAVIPDTPGVEVSWWNEGRHLIVTAGLAATTQALDVIDGKRPNLSQHRLMDELSGVSGMHVTTRGWFDMQALRARFGLFPVPTPSGQFTTVAQVLEILGLNKMGAITIASGYDGRSLASETQLLFDGEPAGLLTLAAQRNIDWSEVPPLPEQPDAFYVTTFDWGRAYDELLASGLKLTGMGQPGLDEQLRNVLAQANAYLEFNLRDDLLESLGDVVCVYGDPRQGFLGTGGAICLQVKDEAKFTACLERLLELLAAESDGDVTTRTVEKHGRTIRMFEFDQVLLAGSIMVSDGWCVVSLIPQAAEAFALRADGVLPRWQLANAKVHANAPLPESFSSVSYINPQPAYEAIAKVAPIAVSALTAALKEERLIPRDLALPVTPADMPLPELLTASMYPNVSSSRTTDDRVVWSSRSSVPSVPFVSGIGGGDMLASSALVAGIVLPAVRQAQIASRNAQSKNNLRFLGIIMHTHHSDHNQFPEGTRPNEAIKVEKRLAWTTAILPYSDRPGLSRTLDENAAWDSEQNLRLARTPMRSLLNPGQQSSGAEKGIFPSHYVGLAGVGEDAPLLPANHPRAGVFGLNRRTSIANITDGTSYTAMISETSRPQGAWTAGGEATIRSLTKKPYINGPDGIGGPFPGGCNMLFADGSVRFISENIDHSVLEALITISGGEVIPEF